MALPSRKDDRLRPTARRRMLPTCRPGFLLRGGAFFRLRAHLTARYAAEALAPLLIARALPILACGSASVALLLSDVQRLQSAWVSLLSRVVRCGREVSHTLPGVIRQIAHRRNLFARVKPLWEVHRP